MPDYRVYFLGGSGDIDHAFQFQSESDLQAIETVGAYPSTHGIELWVGDQLIQLFEASPPA